MAKQRKERLLPQARALYAEGLAKTEIAAALDISTRTLRRWARADADAGRPWSREGSDLLADEPLPEPAGPDPARIRRMLERRLELLAERAECDLDDARLDDRMLKVCRILEHLDVGAQRLEAQLRAAKDFAAFCLRNLPEREVRPVRKAVRMFVEHLKEENT